jgi:hypothetical protein
MVGSVQNRRSVDVRPAEESVRLMRGQTSLALHNLRGVVIVVVVAFHSALAYLGSSPATPFAFDAPPYEWRAFPIIDSHRFFGFDLFCAWQDVYLMGLMFFLSALFTWPSLNRKGLSKFLSDRLLRLGAPFLFGVAVMMPIAVYPVYALSAAHPSLADYARHYLALPFLPNGPMWFLWQLLVLTIAAAALRRLRPDVVERVGQYLSSATAQPRLCFLILAAVSVGAYVPMAILFTPWRWADAGPFAIQFCRPLLYAVFYFGGLTVGAGGLDCGVLAAQGPLARGWRRWLALAACGLFAWMGLTALTMSDGAAAPLFLQFAADATFAIASAASLFFVIAAALRFGAARSRLLDSLAGNAMGIYLLHYAPVVWLQYLLLSTAAPAIIKATIVCVVGLVASWGATAVLRAVPYGRRLIGEEPRRSFDLRAAIAGRFSPAAD